MNSRRISECPAVPMFRRSTNCMYLQNLMGLFSMICIIGSTKCQSSPSNMTLNDTLVASKNQTLLSPKGVFEMGFYAGMQSNGAPPTYTLAIWYAQTSPERTVVWMADRSLNLSSDATLLLTGQGNLEVYNDGDLSAQPQWTSQTTKLNASEAALLDSGNLVLRNRTNQVLWQSFDSPTDTLLPGQLFEASSNVSMFSWQGPGNWSQGSYYLNWTNGALSTFYQQPTIPYSTFTPPDVNYYNFNTNSTYAVLTTEGQFQAADVSGSRSTVLGNSTDVGLTNRLRRFTIDSDGNMRIRSWEINGSSNEWSVEWTAISSNCTLYNFCGFYGICDQSGTGQCMCPQGFQPVNTTDPSQGCKRTVDIVSTLLYNGNTTTVINKLDMYELDFVDMSSGIQYSHYQNVTSTFCIETCLNSSICEACVTSIPDSDGIVTDCWPKQILFAGRKNVEELQTRKTFIKLAVQTRKGISRERKLVIALITLGTASLFLIVVLCPILWFALLRKLKSIQIRRLEEKWIASKGLTVNFTYADIRLATRDFAEEIGKGGYGSVFKGKVGQQALVAVKRLDRLSPLDDEFVNEVNTIGCIHHVNLVKLHGYCAEANHKLLVYEYVENSSLDKFLFHRDEKSESRILEWRSRFRIAIQTARGLAYLHEDVRDQRIIHCDIKPENILLDSKMSVKVADFGLSRILNREQTRTMTKHIRGTCGYLAPEWTSDNTPITAKIDVYSFGMLLLEIVSGRRNLKSSWIQDHAFHDVQPDCRYYPQWAFAKIETEKFLEVVDPSLNGIVDGKQVKRALLVAFWCINDKPDQRPTMSKVVQLLEGHIPIEQPVPRPKILDELDLTSPLERSQLYSSRVSDAYFGHTYSVVPASGHLPSDGSIFSGRS